MGGLTGVFLPAAPTNRVRRTSLYLFVKTTWMTMKILTAVVTVDFFLTFGVTEVSILNRVKISFSSPTTAVMLQLAQRPSRTPSRSRRRLPALTTVP